MEQLTFLPTEPNLLKVATQTRKVERLQRELKAAVRQLEQLLHATAPADNSASTDAFSHR